MAATGKIVIDQERCKGCHLCLDVCPNQIIEVSPKLNKKGYQPAGHKEKQTGEKGCTGCALCAEICPEVAIQVYRVK